jgi:TadE-like protein
MHFRARSPSRRSSTGQSLVEFALVTPIVIMLVVIVADFGRVFAVSLSLEAAARDAAEIGSNEYLAQAPGPLDQPAPPGNATYYQSLHQKIARAVCAETNDLANSAFDPGTGACAGMPLIQACVHDSQDTECASEAQGAVIPAECSGMAAPPLNAQEGTSGSMPLPRWVEVRICYHFTPILQLPLLSFGSFWIEKTRTFTIPCYFALGEAECG